MSAITGVLWLDGRQAAASDLDRLLHHLQYRGTEGSHAVASGPAALGVVHRARVPEDAGVRQPIASDTQEVLVAFDGFLDNREDLRRVLGTAGDAPDARYVLDAYARWGTDAAPHLLGDFAFVVWDAKRRQLFAARDLHGVRPFFYRVTSNAFRWAPDMQSLVRDDMPPINEGMLGEALADFITTLDETLYESVFRLPPAHAMTVGAGRRRVWRYWSPDADRRIEYRTEAEYDEHFRDLFFEAVKTRLRSTGDPALLFSGGVDSSAIAAAAVESRDRGCTDAARLITASISTPGRREDETPYFTAGAAALNLPNLVYPMYYAQDADHVADARRSLDIPEGTNVLMGKPLRLDLAQRGVRVMLTGFGGDTWLSGSQFVFFDRLFRGRWWSAATDLWHDRQLAGYHWKHLLTLTPWVALPEEAKPFVRRLLGRRATPTWIAPAFAARINLEDRLRARTWCPPFRTFAARDLFSRSFNADTFFAGDQEERIEAWYGLTARHPFYDRRLIEFAVAVPNDQLWRRGQPRHLMLRALATRLPAILRDRAIGTEYSHIGYDALQAAGGSNALAPMARTLSPWTTTAGLGALLDSATAHRGDPVRGMGRFMGPLLRMLGIHYWVRAVRGCDDERQA
jgi:asparagine synthase (glutamine-hydrolysing)